LLGGDQDSHRTPRGIHAATVVRRQVAALVEHGQTHHVPAHVEPAHRGHLEHPARRDPCPWAERIEPEVYVHIVLTVSRGARAMQQTGGGRTPTTVRQPWAAACARGRTSR